ncbi:hypothetical protein CYB_0510 [Synechococcus sp. JA-2-3B'a(2-13)]|nr:hypothetical protein CYB_0510 [Synechococcus sp. JA-2-3B'a(2-13)]
MCPKQGIPVKAGKRDPLPAALSVLSSAAHQMKADQR